MIKKPWYKGWEKTKKRDPELVLENKSTKMWFKGLWRTMEQTGIRIKNGRRRKMD